LDEKKKDVVKARFLFFLVSGAKKKKIKFRAMREILHRQKKQTTNTSVVGIAMSSASLESIRHAKSSMVVHNKHASMSLYRGEHSASPEKCFLKETTTMSGLHRNQPFHFVLQPSRKRMEAKAPLQSSDSPLSRSSVAVSHSFLERTKPQRDLTSFVKKRLEYPLEDSSRLEGRGIDWKQYVTQFQHTRLHEKPTSSFQQPTKKHRNTLQLSLKDIFAIYKDTGCSFFPTFASVDDQQAWQTIHRSLSPIFGQ